MENIIAVNYPTNPLWPAELKIKLVVTSLDAGSARYAWTANGANDSKDATINAAALAPSGIYATISTALSAARRKGWMLPETPETIAASALGRKGGKSRSAAKTTAARANAEKARDTIDRQKQGQAVAAANRRRKQG